MGYEAAEAHLFRYVCTNALLNHLCPRKHPTNSILGKILKDDETVGSYKIEEKGYVVCMVNKVSRLFCRDWMSTVNGLTTGL